MYRKYLWKLINGTEITDTLSGKVIKKINMASTQKTVVKANTQAARNDLSFIRLNTPREGESISNNYQKKSNMPKI